VYLAEYQNLLQTIKHFEKLGYQYIDVPWVVSDEAICATHPSGTGSIFQGKHVVGSAEQSFVQLMLDGKLPRGLYCALTPCFRDEAELSEFTSLHFMKVELIDTAGDPAAVESMLHYCQEWFETLQPHKCEVVPTGNARDITLHGIELGSYGHRNYEHYDWVYGTALAEPRFSTVIKKYSQLES
jgi:seryl-tRNA synthetase